MKKASDYLHILIKHISLTLINNNNNDIYLI